MYFIAVVVTLLAILSKGDADVGVCKLPAPVEKFAASYYTALIVDHDPDIVNTLSVDGDEAAMLIYRVAQKALKEYNYQKCDGEELAFIVGRSVAQVKNLTLPYYFNFEAYTVGSILYQFGVLNCTNAVPLALEYLQYNREDFAHLDPHKFDSYMHEIIFGGFKLYLNHGLKLEIVLAPTADVFNQLFTEDKKKIEKCKAGKSTIKYSL